MNEGFCFTVKPIINIINLNICTIFPLNICPFRKCMLIFVVPL